jgi:hypothetical protein
MIILICVRGLLGQGLWGQACKHSIKTVSIESWRENPVVRTQARSIMSLSVVISGRTKSGRMMIKKLFHLIEQRLLERYPVKMPVSFAVVEADTLRPVTGIHKGRIVEICESGCRLEIDKLSFDGFHLLKCLEETAAYRLRIVLHDESTEIKGILRWINSDSRRMWQGFVAGIEFVAPIPKEDLNKLIS